jgi:hypothetical protein
MKKCCLHTSMPEQSSRPNSCFSLKGKKAEEVVHHLAQKTFLTDWCYQNPCIQKGKELCDLLIVFDDVAIVWQIKDLKLDSDGKYSKSEVDKNLRQLSGAKRTLFEVNKPIELTNSKRGTEKFDPKKIKEVYLISALMGKGEDSFAFIEEFKKLTIHVFNRDFTQIVLNELDTINDFVGYLRSKEALVKTNKRIIVLGGEEEMLAYYLTNDRSFDKLENVDSILVTDDGWKYLQNRPEYIAKKSEDKISYCWDGIISRAHESGTTTYELVARELARPNRFERRYLSKAFYDAHVIAHKGQRPDMYRRLVVGNDAIYCFLFMDDPEPRKKRSDVLFAMCHVARGKYRDQHLILGIATEKKIEPTCSYDFCLYNKPDWTENDQKLMDTIQKETGIFVNPDMKIVSEDEYPIVKK